MRILLDTNCYSEMDRGDARVVRRLETSEFIGVPVIVLGELFAGFERGSLKKQNEQQLRRFLKQPPVRVVYANVTTARRYGRTLKALKQLGKPIPTNDIWIASLALQHDLHLYSRDGHFLHIPGLKLVKE